MEIKIDQQFKHITLILKHDETKFELTLIIGWGEHIKEKFFPENHVGFNLYHYGNPYFHLSPDHSTLGQQKD